MKVAGVSVTFVSVHQTTRRHNPNTTSLTFTAVRNSHLSKCKQVEG